MLERVSAWCASGWQGISRLRLSVASNRQAPSIKFHKLKPRCTAQACCTTSAKPCCATTTAKVCRASKGGSTLSQTQHLACINLHQSASICINLHQSASSTLDDKLTLLSFQGAPKRPLTYAERLQMLGLPWGNRRRVFVSLRMLPHTYAHVEPCPRSLLTKYPGFQGSTCT